MQNEEQEKGTEGIGPELSKNEVSSMELNGKMQLPLALQTHFGDNQVNIMRKESKKGVEEISVQFE